MNKPPECRYVDGSFCGDTGCPVHGQDDIVDLSDAEKAPAALIEGLRRHGLDICSAAERQVLDAVALVPVTWLEMAVASSQITRGVAAMAAAELARRGAK